MGSLLFRMGKLVMRAGRLVYATCAACCGGPGYWKACECPRPQPPNDPCNPTENPPPPPPRACVYISDSVGCNNRPVRPGDVLFIGGHCYTVQGPHLNTVPPGTAVITGGTCMSGCTDDRCVNPVYFSGYGKAIPCHGPSSEGIDVFFCKRLVTTCVYVKVGDECYKLDPFGPSFPGPILPPAIVIIPAPPYTNSCCECLHDLCTQCFTRSEGYNVGGDLECWQGAPTPCQCLGPDDPEHCTMNVEARLDFWTENGEYHEITEVSYAGPCNPPGGAIATVHFRAHGFSQGQFIDIDRTDLVALFGVGFTGCFGNPETFGAVTLPAAECQNHPSGIIWSFTRTCTSAQFDYRAGVIGLNGTLIHSTISRNGGTAPAAYCADGCGGASVPLNQAYGPPAVPVPPGDWPQWANEEAGKRVEGDRGLGDTINRVIGPIGGAAFKKWYRDKTGKDCGCGARADLLNGWFSYS